MSSTNRALALLLLTTTATTLAAAQDPATPADGVPAATASWPARVLITNDDGIEDESRLVALAAAFDMAGAEVVVAVPRENRSGTGHQMNLAVRSSQIRVERLVRHEKASDGPAAAFYVVDGFPADCVAFAVAGPMRESPPDLVVSGINGGANLAEAWLGSGTIGAARVAAYIGIPALAISGIDEEDPGAPRPLADWVARLAASEPVRRLPPGTYLTVALPPRPLDELAGIRVAPRSSLRFMPVLARQEKREGSPDGEIWEIGDALPREVATGSDSELYDAGFVVITPMRANEDDEALIAKLQAAAASLPALRQR